MSDRLFTENLKPANAKNIFTLWSEAIANDDLPYNVLLRINKTFFGQITRHRSITQIDGDGCIRIMAALIRSEYVVIKTDALTKMIGLVSARVRGTEMMRLCTNDAIIRELSEIIISVKEVSIRSHAIELACLIQKANREAAILEEAVFRDCVCSDHKGIQRSLAELLRLMLRIPNSDIINPFDVLIRATEIYQTYRRDDTHCPRRLVRTFYTEFTDWDAVFQAIQLRLSDDVFIEDLFCLLERVFQQIKASQNKEQAEELIRSYLHKAIKFVNKLGRQHVKVYTGVIFSLSILKDDFELMMGENKLQLADIISEICTDYISEFPHQMNTISLFKMLIEKGYIVDELRRARLNQCVKELDALKSTLETGENLETNSNVMRTFMKLAAFAWYRMIAENAVVLSKRTHALAMTDRLDLNQNRTLLAYSLIIMVYAHNEVVASGQTTPDVSFTEITTRLLDICDQTDDDLDFLSLAVFWCVVQMEMNFKCVVPRKDTIFFTRYLLKKISLVNVSPQHGVDSTQLDIVRQMLGALQVLLKLGRDIDIREIVVNLQKKFPDYDFASQMVMCYASIGQLDMLSRCVIDVLSELDTKKAKQEFIVAVERLVIPLRNSNAVRDKIIRAAINQFGKRKQEELDGRAEKEAKHVMDVIREVTFKNFK